jgi:hypothetical protein
MEDERVNIWLVRAATGRVRVKWRDEETVIHDRDFDAEQVGILFL